jgi:hypothetical protein
MSEGVGCFILTGRIGGFEAITQFNAIDMAELKLIILIVWEKYNF